MPQIPSPLPYHAAIVEHLKAEEPGLWEWYVSARTVNADADAVRLDLLKTTYRLEPQSQPRIYELAASACERMQLSCAVTLYQAQTGSAMNAALVYLPGEAHIVLSGSLATALSEAELRAVLSHELAHFRLFEEQRGEYLVATDLLHAMSADPVVGNVASESTRLNRLWMEIYADRWACHASDDLAASIAALVKTETGASEVNTDSYLRQADEIFSKGEVRADHFSHPETYIRARALRLWSEQGDGANVEIERMIEGGLNLKRLDLLGQKRAANLTRRFLQTLLSPPWYRTEPILAHARRFFPDFVANGAEDVDSLKMELDRGDSSLADYFCFLMLDFVTVDRDLGDVALSAAIVLSRRLGCEARLAELVQKELSLGKKAFARIDKAAEALLAKTGTVHAT